MISEEQQPRHDGLDPAIAKTIGISVVRQETVPSNTDPLNPNVLDSRKRQPFAQEPGAGTDPARSAERVLPRYF